MSFLSRGERTPVDPQASLVRAAHRYVAAASRHVERNTPWTNIRLGMRTARLMDAAAQVMPDHPAVLAWQEPDGSCVGADALDIANMALELDALAETGQPHGGAPYIEGAA